MTLASSDHPISSIRFFTTGSVSTWAASVLQSHPNREAPQGSAGFKQLAPMPSATCNQSGLASCKPTAVQAKSSDHHSWMPLMPRGLQHPLGFLSLQAHATTARMRVALPDAVNCACRLSVDCQCLSGLPGQGLLPASEALRPGRAELPGRHAVLNVPFEAFDAFHPLTT